MQDSPAFGSGCKRFNPKVMIINWALEKDSKDRKTSGARPTAAAAADSGSAARWTPGGQENELLAHSSPHADQACFHVGHGLCLSPPEQQQHTPGERLRTSHSRKRTPWAAMSYDGVSAEHNAISAMDLAALQLRGEAQYTPLERRQLHSGGICGWDAGSPVTHPAMADARQTQRERSTARQAAERPGPSAGHAHTANPVQQVCKGVRSN